MSKTNSLHRNLSLVFLLALPAFTHASTLTVTSLADDGSAGTLRDLCASAADGDEIVFDASLAGRTIAITTASGPIEITKALSIVGPADAPITIDGRGGAGGHAYSMTSSGLPKPPIGSATTIAKMGLIIIVR